MGCCESSLWNPNYKRLSLPNGINLTSNNKKNWLNKAGVAPKLNIKFSFDITEPSGAHRTEPFSDEVIEVESGQELSTLLNRHLIKVKKDNIQRYDELCRNCTLDPNKTQILLSFTRKGAEYVEWYYKKFSQISIITEQDAEYFIELAPSLIEQPKSRCSSTRASTRFDTIASISQHTVTTAPSGSLDFGRGENAQKSSKVKKPKRSKSKKSKRSKSRRKSKKRKKVVKKSVES